jgi:hypothetical protein
MKRIIRFCHDILGTMMTTASKLEFNATQSAPRISGFSTSPSSGRQGIYHFWTLRYKFFSDFGYERTKPYGLVHDTSMHVAPRGKLATLLHLVLGRYVTI